MNNSCRIDGVRPLRNRNQTIGASSKGELTNNEVEADVRKFWQLKNERAHPSGQHPDEKRLTFRVSTRF